MSDSVTIGIMADHYLEYIMVRDLTNLVAARWNEIGGRVIWAHGDVGHLDVGRNRVAEQFLRGTSDWLLWIDSDMSFTPADFDALYRRARNGNPIVSALYYRDSEPPTPCMFRYKDGHSRVVKDFRKGSVVRVDGVGFGFILTHRDVFEKMAVERFSEHRPWFDNSVIGPHGQPLSDDLSFCYRVGQMGFPILVDTAVKVGHVKPRIIHG